jgi:hypothetical protein
LLKGEKKMEKKKSKGLFSALFAPKSNSGCCNVQFEEITEEKDLTDKRIKDNPENKNADKKESPENKDSDNSCGCGCC